MVDSRFSAVTTTSSRPPAAAAGSEPASAARTAAFSANAPATVAAHPSLHLLFILVAPCAQFIFHDLTVTTGPITLQRVHIFPGAAPVIGNGRDRCKIFRIELQA